KIVTLVFFFTAFSLSATGTFENWFDLFTYYDDFVDVSPSSDFDKYCVVGNSYDGTFLHMTAYCLSNYGWEYWSFFNSSSYSEGRAVCSDVNGSGWLVAGISLVSSERFPIIFRFDGTDYLSIIDSVYLDYYDSTDYTLYPHDLIPSISGDGYLLIGSADMFDVDTLVKAFIIKFDSSYNILWEHYYSFYPYSRVYGKAIAQNGPYYGLGGAVRDTLNFDLNPMIMVLDAAGNFVDAQVYDFSEADDAVEDICGSDLPDHFGLTGRRMDSIFVIDYIMGGYVWERGYKIDPSFDNAGSCIMEAPANSYIVGGYGGDSFANYYDGLICLYIDGFTGDIIWSKYDNFPLNKGIFGGCYDDLDSGIVLVGCLYLDIWTGSMHDAYITKLDPEGGVHPEWWLTYGGNEDDEFFSVFPFPYGSTFLTGYSTVNNMDIDGYLINVDNRGEIIWEDYWGDPDKDEKITSFVYDYDLDQIFIAGNVEDFNSSYGFMMKLDSMGNLINLLVYPIAGEDYQIYSATQVEDNTKAKGFILIGSTQSTTDRDQNDIFAMYVSENFDTVYWDTAYVSTEDRVGMEVVEDNLSKAKGFILIGSTQSTTEDTVSFLYSMKFDELGTMLWEQTYFQGEGNSIIDIDSSAIIVTGYKMNDDKDLFIMGIDRNTGNQLWLLCPDLVGDQVGYDLAFLPPDTVIICGYSENSAYSPHNFKNALIMKFDTLGNYVGMVEYFDDGNQVACNIDVTWLDSCYVWSGYTDYDGQQPKDALFVKSYTGYAYTVGIEETLDPISNSDPVIEFSPQITTVFSNSAEISFSVFAPGHVSLKIYDLSGRLVKTFTDQLLFSGYYSFVWNGVNSSGESICSGVYFCRLTFENQSLCKKLTYIE
ncbi:MAG: hypothetical protein APR63_06025, partial [Desulfuromonas sp. SDB]